MAIAQNYFSGKSKVVESEPLYWLRMFQQDLQISISYVMVKVLMLSSIEDYIEQSVTSMVVISMFRTSPIFLVQPVHSKYQI